VIGRYLSLSVANHCCLAYHNNNNNQAGITTKAWQACTQNDSFVVLAGVVVAGIFLFILEKPFLQMLMLKRNSRSS
jgi:hypothetical protein